MDNILFLFSNNSDLNDSPDQYNDYTGNLYRAYNVPAPSTRPYASNYTKPKYNNDFQMVVAVVVLDGKVVN